MLEYIKQQLAAQQPVTFEDPTPSDDDMDSLVTEYATSIFQELDDLSIEGADAHRERPIELDIPIEEDVELDTVELNLMDNRLVDIPMDVTTNMESFVEQMKTFEDFYQEACEVIKPFDRDDEDMLNMRRTNYAKKHYDAYHTQMVQEGLFGFEQVSMNDPSVPASVMESFGSINTVASDQKYIVKMPVMFEMTKDQTIFQSQLDALKVANVNAIYEQFTDVLKDRLNTSNPWNIVTPKRVIVPKTMDDYEIIVEFEHDGKNTPIYEGWAYRRKPSERDIEVHAYPHDSIKDIVESINMMNKRDYIHQEATATIVPDRWNINEIYQEAGTTRGKRVNYVSLGELIGIAGVTLTALGISCIPGVGGLTMLDLLVLDIAGALGGNIAGGIFFKGNFDNIMSKTITKKIAKVTKYLAEENSGVVTTKIRKLKKYVKDLRDEMVSDLRDINEGKYPKAYLSKKTITTFTELRDACGDVLSTIETDRDPSNRECLRNLMSCMENTMRLIASPVKTNDMVTEAFELSNELEFIFESVTPSFEKWKKALTEGADIDADHDKSIYGFFKSINQGYKTIYRSLYAEYAGNGAKYPGSSLKEVNASDKDLREKWDERWKMIDSRHSSYGFKSGEKMSTDQTYYLKTSLKKELESLQEIPKMERHIYNQLIAKMPTEANDFKYLLNVVGTIERMTAKFMKTLNESGDHLNSDVFTELLNAIKRSIAIREKFMNRFRTYHDSVGQKARQQRIEDAKSRKQHYDDIDKLLKENNYDPNLKLDEEKKSAKDKKSLFKKIKSAFKSESYLFDMDSEDYQELVQEYMLSEEDEDRLIQEAIDFGYPDETTEAAKQNQPAPGGDATNNDPSAPTVSTDTNTETPPPTEDAPIDANADNMEQPPATDTPPVEGEEPKTPLDPNDVSDQIANNVMDNIDNQEQQNQDTGVDPNGDISIDDNTTPPDNSTPDTNDMSDSVNFDNIDTSLDNLDTNATDASTDDTTMGDPANMDINTMSIDDIMAQAAEKLKSMPIEQVKQFLSDGAVGMESYQEPVRQASERSRLNDELKNLLGILNSGKKLPELVDSFKKYGKLMNADITKVTKDSKEFTKSEIQLLNTLTARTNNLMIAIKPTSDKTQTDHIKACIKDFLAITDKARKILDK